MHCTTLTSRDFYFISKWKSTRIWFKKISFQIFLHHHPDYQKIKRKKKREREKKMYAYSKGKHNLIITCYLNRHNISFIVFLNKIEIPNKTKST